MAVFSEAAQEMKKTLRKKEVAERWAPIIAERRELFKKFRAANVSVAVIDPDTAVLPSGFITLPDDVQRTDVHFTVKFPGAYPVHVTTIVALNRLSRGI